DALGGIEWVLADDPGDPGDDTGEAEDDSGAVGDDTAPESLTVSPGPCGCTPISGAASWPWLLTLAMLRRRRVPA
ncbi:MAG: hypothetical protein JRJ84_11685, partial [Deltaproteobacteria bacterium]|nr:hypothetical protein [Deltaproteobacteria bacterium]